ncbi:hypothetical protein BDA99DRAFT_204314 [Phascolomyces articulosus]|uniref:RING-type domain-containing protein n=1 Tax=Phascolomyces articulosus TaxID=60185 RepID=A0AAD5JR99_9FUNG|nr:hypothetical protein BDA99DRAFT_204314 [Phascolomyces articulosus]
MPRHSKNNTASSVFTYHETKSLDYGTKKQRLGRDSFREYDACFLCLQTARDPVACPQGHLACRECMYESILTQKQNIKREQRLLEQKLQALEEKKDKETEEARQVMLDQFEKTQTSMLGHRRQPVKKKEEEKEKEEDKNTQGVKRKIQDATDEDQLERTAKRLAEEKADKSKSKLSSFWLPTMTPEAEKQYKDEIKPIQTQTMCTAVKIPHPVSLKSLIDVKFQYEDEAKKKCQCPACLKSLSNASKFSVMRSCGHVVCNTCVDMFVKKTKRCYVCEAKIKSKDIVDMSPEGTGFASGSSMAEAKKWGVAFQ